MRSMSSSSNSLQPQFTRAHLRREIKQRLFNTGMEVVGSTPQELGATLQSEMTRMGKLIKVVGIREE